MASLIRQVSRLARQNILVNLVGARAASSGVPPSQSINEKTRDNPLTSVEDEVRVNQEGFFSEMKRRSSDPAATSTPGELKITGASDGIPEFGEVELGSVAGAHRAELLEQLRGSEDPFDVGLIKQGQFGAGTHETPIIVPTCEGSRLVGCVCEEDTGEVVWMMIHSNEKKSCDCGNWFQGVSVPGARTH
ncbi:Cytochrome c oxidase subunit 5B [Mactra antiquata]